ncbi:MAG: sugar ABC transporter permease [Anaerolineae bacterium]|nr:sugar ABC transporter permease [Anaerolineae bacterium]
MATFSSRVSRIMSGSGSSDKAGLWPYIFVTPTIAFMLVLTFMPVLFQVWMSFTDFSLSNLRMDPEKFMAFINPPKNVGLENYRGILAADQAVIKIAGFYFWRTLFFNLWWAVSSVFTTTVAGIVIAVLLNAEGLWFKKFYRVLFILPMTMPSIVVNTVWRNMFDRENGAINLALMSIGGVFGFSPETFQIDWLGSVSAPLAWLFPELSIAGQPILFPMPTTYFAMLISNFWRGWPWVVVVATAALQSIPKELYEAAAMDGASGVRKFFNITLPLLKPAVVPAAILSFSWTFNLLDISYFLTQGQPFYQTEILVSVLYRLVNEQRLYGVGAAFSMIIFVVSIILFIITNRMLKATEAADV